MKHTVIFDSMEAFDTWHDAEKQKLGFPKVGVNARTGEPMPGKQQTNEIIKPIINANSSDKRVGAELKEEFKPGTLQTLTQEQLEEDGWFK